MSSLRVAQIRRVDLGLLTTLQALVEERSVTRAAERMNLSQPAMSRALERLRKLFGHELLVRTKQGYEPTHHALRLYAEIGRVLPRIEGLLRGDDHFDPEAATDTFHVAATEYAGSVLLPAFMKEIATIAPKIMLRIYPCTDRLFHHLETGAVDLVLWANAVSDQFRTQPLFRDRFVCLVRKGHPIGTRRPTLARYLSYPHALIALADHQQGIIDQALQVKGLARRVQLEIPYFSCAAWNIEHSDMILTLPQRLALRLAGTSQTRMLKAPIELPELEYIQVWHPRIDSDPAHQWFRRMILEAARAQAPIR
jgi:DNA-binding transcriptional LysR family regulator